MILQPKLTYDAVGSVSFSMLSVAGLARWNSVLE